MESSKWVAAVSPDDSVHMVALRTLESRLADVEHYLPLAALSSQEDVEHVHQLRVATRRAVAASKLYRRCFPSMREELCQSLKAIRRAAGQARDLDVLVARLESSATDLRAAGFLAVVKHQRQQAQEPLQAAYEATQGAASLRQLWEALRRGAEQHSTAVQPKPFPRFARRQLRKVVRKFFDAEPREMDDLEALHAFRIRGKQLRYAIELLVAGFPAKLREQLYPRLEQLQDRLGAINDHVVALGRYQHWREQSADRAERQYLKRLIRSEEQQLRAALRRFARWWTPHRSQLLRRHFDRLTRRLDERE